MPFELKEEDLSNKSDELLAVSPYGKVPVLAIDGVSVYESAVINEYLEETYPNNPLMPENPYDRAQVRIWTDYAASRFVKPLYGVFRAKDPEQEKESRQALCLELEYLETHFKSISGNWFVGETFSLADINMLPFIYGVSRLDGDLLADFTAIQKWIESFQQRASFKETLAID